MKSFQIVSVFLVLALWCTIPVMGVTTISRRESPDVGSNIR